MSRSPEMSHPALTRRESLALLSIAAASVVLPAGAIARGLRRSEQVFRISLAQWSLNRALFGGRLDHLDFPKAAKQEFGIDAVEYVNQFWKKKADPEYDRDLRKRCDDLGVGSLLIMCDGEGALGDPDESKRKQAVENHRKWLDSAAILGCHSIRVNAHSGGTYDEQRDRAADGLRRLCELADPMGLNVIVENHGGLSSNGAWLAAVMRQVGHKRVGTLPDFGNFRISDKETYDRYKGTEELMPFARGVSAKSYDFDPQGNETTIDYRRMLRIVRAAGYSGFIGIEYEGGRLSEAEGIAATKRLLERIRDEFTAAAKQPGSDSPEQDKKEITP
ncbi:MAG: sugar phosphate isomerase/epimerase [Phycisphaeraceae bacterium]|nr:sugar phosphate isomerase/epimerase [Phycisphaeraceae bacterium]